MSIIDSAKSAAQTLVQGAMSKLVPLAPDSWIPGGVPDPLIARKHGLIGTPVSRLDGPLKVQGRARFSAEVDAADIAYAALVHAAVPRGRIATLDTAAARAAPGVILVMTHENAPRMNAPALFGSSPTAVGPADLPVMQDDRIHWNGQPIAIVLAETQEQADHARSLVVATYSIEPSITSLKAAKDAGPKPGLFMGEPLLTQIGDAEAFLSAAPYKIDHLYRTPRHNHNPIELHGATIWWDGDTLVIHDATQMVTAQGLTIAGVFDLKPEQVHILSPYVGGGFGSKGLWVHQIIGAAAAKLAGRPVRIALSREGVYRIVGGRTLTEQRVAIGAQADGCFTSIIHSGIAAMTPHNNMPEPFILGTKVGYGADSFKLSVETVEMDMVANTFMRAPGEAVGTFALECAIDELAAEIGMDPVDLRILNEPVKDPISGLPFSSRHIVEAWRRGAERFGWSERITTPGTRREGEWLIGMGCATGTYPYYRMPGAAARITLTRNGTATVEIAAHEMGMGTSTTTAIVAAERLGLPMDKIDVRYGDSTIPGAIMAGGSQQTAAIGGAVIAAHNALVAQLLKMAGNDSPLAGLTSAEVGSEDGALVKLDDPTRRESYASILNRAQMDSIVASEEASQPLEMMHWSMHSHSAIFCEIAVNSITAETRVRRILGSFDCGRILNPKTARSQFRGGMIMGLGMALMEETQFDERNGRIMNPSLSEYHIPVHLDVPDIDVIWTDIADPHTPMGAHGIGEIGITGTAAAVANAVYNATGKRVRDLPITLDKLL
ncbi:MULTISPECIES: xanthine dehydrogenase family protein molybdopterin-binding subunit [Sphingobium]|jgi:xanthine dehydrogenase YagR molybdenum-binding subunit|uniref:Xanthine dehydrogenase family protein molybdopterin-binding subunit n=1 Tax=Sphingobium limneticum TaxID=1007511 RepID=A0A5J5HT52_9SPHN|nr:MULTISPECIES: xanthine dehydrogenase family protein molybdopterin-binding subunit [Sphingobium]KAA9011023.1 xanthine dehydrogenase family protein molybdopterin-binding subunit [Sphingobium limneticum]KAA9011606.1 xanthine dehydrogenase family protein molybdopterin-binding subunit [Sphingobium limneticum]KAA9024200.1 xanthine dehydrogenase family protein molybdopterin-binding subunit [Sphingobium limneticum]